MNLHEFDTHGKSLLYLHRLISSIVGSKDSIDIQHSNDVALVGLPYDTAGGQVVMFIKNEKGTWTRSFMFNGAANNIHGFGFKVAISPQGDTIAISAYRRDSNQLITFIYKSTGILWGTLITSDIITKGDVDIAVMVNNVRCTIFNGHMMYVFDIEKRLPDEVCEIEKISNKLAFKDEGLFIA